MQFSFKKVGKESKQQLTKVALLCIISLFLSFSLVSASSPSLQNNPSNSDEVGLPSLNNKETASGNITNNYYNISYINTSGTSWTTDQNDELNTTGSP